MNTYSTINMCDEIGHCVGQVSRFVYGVRLWCFLMAALESIPYIPSMLTKQIIQHIVNILQLIAIFRNSATNVTFFLAITCYVHNWLCLRSMFTYQSQLQ